MNHFLMLNMNLLKIVLIICLSIEGLAFIGGLIFILMNPDVKGISKMDIMDRP